ncbi:MAG: hypothetical protein ACOZAL_00890 [Patescibacteria group bacterium]
MEIKNNKEIKFIVEGNLPSWGKIANNWRALTGYKKRWIWIVDTALFIASFFPIKFKFNKAVISIYREYGFKKKPFDDSNLQSVIDKLVIDRLAILGFFQTKSDRKVTYQKPIQKYNPKIQFDKIEIQIKEEG